MRSRLFKADLTIPRAFAGCTSVVRDRAMRMEHCHEVVYRRNTQNRRKMENQSRSGPSHQRRLGETKASMAVARPLEVTRGPLPIKSEVEEGLGTEVEEGTAEDLA